MVFKWWFYLMTLIIIRGIIFLTNEYNLLLISFLNKILSTYSYPLRKLVNLVNNIKFVNNLYYSLKILLNFFKTNHLSLSSYFFHIIINYPILTSEKRSGVIRLI